MAGGGLVVRAEPVADAFRFLGAAVGVELDDAGDDFGGGEVWLPAIGGGDFAIEAVVQVAQEGDSAGVVDVFLRRRERRSGAEGFEDVVEAGHGELVVDVEADAAQGVEFLGQGGDGGTLLWGGEGERERVEAAGLVVARVVADAEPAAGGERPLHVDAGGEDAEVEGVVGGDADEHVVGDDGSREEAERAMFRRFDGCDEAGEVDECLAKLNSWFAETPPRLSITSTIVLLALWFYVRDHLLHNRAKRLSRLCFGYTKEVDHHHATAALSEIASIQVRADVMLKAGHPPEPECTGLTRGDDEACAVQFHTGRGDAGIGCQRLRFRGVGADSQIGVDHSVRFFQLHGRDAVLARLFGCHSG